MFSMKLDGDHPVVPAAQSLAAPESHAVLMHRGAAAAVAGAGHAAARPKLHAHLAADGHATPRHEAAG